MNPMRRSIIVAASAGAGFAIVLSLAFGLNLWYKSRPKEWNQNAITARFDDIDTGGQDRGLIFYFDLENVTNSDYTIPDKSSISIMAKRKEHETLIPLQGIVTLEISPSIPAHQRLRVAIYFPGPYSEEFYSSRLGDLHTDYIGSRKGRIIIRPDEIDNSEKAIRESEKATRENKQNYIRDPAAFVKKELGNLDGFVLYDHANKFQINFPKGW